MKLASTIILSIIFLGLRAQEVYFKSIDVDRKKDSISGFVDSISDISIQFSQSSYWSSRADTTTKPNLHNYDLYLYKDSADKAYAIIINPYFIFGPYQTEFPSIDFFDLYQYDLLNTDLRPDKRDAVVDTSYFTETGMPLNDSTYMLAAYYPHRGTIIDGTNKTVVLTSGSKNTKINYDRRLIDPDDFYYPYNSIKPFYTLILLLENDWETIKGAIEGDVELAQQGILTNEDRVKWMLEQVPERQRELREFKQYLKQELKELKKEKTGANKK